MVSLRPLSLVRRNRVFGAGHSVPGVGVRPSAHTLDPRLSSRRATSYLVSKSQRAERPKYDLITQCAAYHAAALTIYVTVQV